jgi:hemin uptake protein HemP
MNPVAAPTLSLPRPRPMPLQVQSRLRSEDLFRGRNELIIEHQGQEYRLRLTRNDKLILNK